MMENQRPEEENIIKGIRNLFRLKKELNYNTIKDLRNLLRQEKETKTIKPFRAWRKKLLQTSKSK